MVLASLLVFLLLMMLRGGALVSMLRDHDGSSSVIATSTDPQALHVAKVRLGDVQVIAAGVIAADSPSSTPSGRALSPLVASTKSISSLVSGKDGKSISSEAVKADDGEGAGAESDTAEGGDGDATDTSAVEEGDTSGPDASNAADGSDRDVGDGSGLDALKESDEKSGGSASASGEGDGDGGSEPLIEEGASGTGVDPDCMGDLEDTAFRHRLRSDGRLNIWFIRTSNEKALGHLDACAVSSAAEKNPTARVLVLSNTLGCKAARAIHPDVRIVRFRYEGVYRAFPALAAWYRSGVWKGPFDRNNLGNALRLALLYRYGGAYFDTDVLSLRPLGPDEPNFIGVERDSVLNNAALGFSQRHPFLERAIQRFVREFKKIWGWNGPALLTRTWQSLGHGAVNRSLHSRVAILPQHEFYGLPFASADDFFAPLDSPRAAKWLKYFETRPPRALHVWNKKLKGKMKGIGKAVGAQAPAGGTALGGADDSGNGTAVAEGSSGGAGAGEEEAHGSGGGQGAVPSFVEYLMRHSCPAYLSRAHPVLTAAVDAARPEPPSLPSVSFLSKHALWLHWPPGRDRRVMWGGSGSEPARARRVVAVRGAQQLLPQPAEGDAGKTGASAVPLSAEAEDDVCGVPSGPSGPVAVGCGAAIPLPFTEKASYAWTASVWFKITPAPGAGNSDATCEGEGCGASPGAKGSGSAAETGAAGTAPPVEEADASDPRALAPQQCAALRCQSPDCDTAAMDLPSSESGGAGAGGGRRRRKKTPTPTPSPSPSNAPPASVSTTSVVIGAVSMRVTPSGKLRLRFPSGLMTPITKVPIASGTWRSLTVVYDSRQRRSSDGRVTRQSVSLYLDGLLVSERHAGAVRLNSTIIPAQLLVGRAQGAGASGGAAPRVVLGAATVYQGHLNDQAVLELHNAEVRDALEQAASQPMCVSAAAARSAPVAAGASTAAGG